MNKQEQLKKFKELTSKMEQTFTSKGNDYANQDEVLANFKQAGAIVGIGTERQILSLIATKVARLGNLLSGVQPKHESIEDSILDLSVYTFLLYCSVSEKEFVVKKKPFQLPWVNENSQY